MAGSEYLFKLSATGGNEVKGTFKDVAKTGDDAFKTMEQSSSNAFKYAKMALGGIAALSAVNQFTGMVKGAIDAQDELGKMSQKVGISVEDLSKLAYAGKLADLSTEQLNTGLNKLNKGMVEAASGGGALFNATKTMGIGIRDVNGDLKTNTQMLSDVSDKFATYKDGAQKSALAMAIFGKSGAEMIPMLNGGSQALKDAGFELDKFGAVVTTGGAKASEEFNDNLTRLSVQSSGLAKSVANALLPSMNGFVQSLIDGKVYLKEHTAEVVGVAGAVGALGSAYLVFAQRAAIAKASAMIVEGVATAIEIARGGTVAWTIAVTALNASLKLTKIALIGTGIGAFAVGAGFLAEAAYKASSQMNAQGEDRIKLIEDEKNLIVQGIANYEKNGKSAQKLDTIRSNGLERLISLEAEIQSIRGSAKSASIDTNAGKSDAPILIDQKKLDDERKKAEQAAAAIQEIILGARNTIGKEQDKFARSMDNSFLSETQRRLAEDISKVTDAIKDRQEQIQKMVRKGDIDPAIAIKAQAELNTIQDAGIQRARDLITVQESLNSSWSYGATKALRSYADEAVNTAKLVEGAFTRATKSMEDSLVNFVMTGKLNFATLANSMISDMIRIAIQQSITGPLAKAGMSAFSSMFNSGYGSATEGSANFIGPMQKNGGAWDSGIQAFANGGAFTNSIVDNPTLFKFAKGTGMMGEAGPEGILPLKRNSSGQLGVISSGGGGGSVNINIVNQGSSDGYKVSATAKKNDSGFDIDVMFRKAMSNDINSNGPVSQQLAGTYGLRRFA